MVRVRVCLDMVPTFRGRPERAALLAGLSAPKGISEHKPQLVDQSLYFEAWSCRRPKSGARVFAMFENVGKALTLIREIRGMSQTEVARQAGTGKSQISKYENGKELPRLHTLRNVLTALNIGAFEFWYTVHLIDMQVEKLDVSEQMKAQLLPPLPLSGPGLLSNETDSAFKRLLGEVMHVYHSMWREKIKTSERKGS